MPIEVTPLGILIEANAEHPMKAPEPIEVILDGRVIEGNAEQR